MFRNAPRLLGLMFQLCWCAGAVIEARAQEIVIHVVRHAEKADPTDPDTPLSPEGQVRAQELARVMKDRGISAVFASERQRTRQTAQPTAEAAGVPVIAIPANEQDRLIGRLRYLPAGGHALVAGHSHTVPSIVKELCGHEVPPIAENEFNNLYTVTLMPDGTSRMEHTTYGEPPR